MGDSVSLSLKCQKQQHQQQYQQLQKQRKQHDHQQQQYHQHQMHRHRRKFHLKILTEQQQQYEQQQQQLEDDLQQEQQNLENVLQKQQQQPLHHKNDYHQKQEQLFFPKHQRGQIQQQELEEEQQKQQNYDHSCWSKSTKAKTTITKPKTIATKTTEITRETTKSTIISATTETTRTKCVWWTHVVNFLSLTAAVTATTTTKATAVTATKATKTKTTSITTTKALPWLLATLLLTIALATPPSVDAAATTRLAQTTTQSAVIVDPSVVGVGVASSSTTTTTTATKSKTKTIPTHDPPGFDLEFEEEEDEVEEVGVGAEDEEAGDEIEIGGIVSGNRNKNNNNNKHINGNNNKNNNDIHNNNKKNNNVPSSNEQQLLEFYKQAQKQQQHQQQQQQHDHQQQQHRHRQREAPEVSFDDIMPTAGVVSALTAAEGGRQQVATSSLTATATSTAATTATANVTTTSSAPAAAKCEPRVLDEITSEPFYDYTDIAEDAARQFTEFLATKFTGPAPPSQQTITDQLREEVRRRANGIASYALNQDDSLLAFAIAAPSIHTVVVKFRDNVTIPPEQVHNKAFLGSYWRELGSAWNSSDGSQDWGAPFRDCNLLKGRWLWPFRISFTEYKIKIVAAAFIAADEDLCNDGLEEIFGRRHGCDRNTTFCLLTESKPSATRDAYTCICSESFYLPNSTLQGFPGDVVEMSEGYDNYSCIPCPGGCSTCDQNGVCLFGEPQETVSMENLLRVSVGSVLGACILCCAVLGVIVFRQRKCKAIATGMWTVLETILLGIVLLYASVAVHFFPASTERCLLEPWLRELGFVTCYGAIILKLYRHLVDFRTRKAHRWVLRDVDLLKYLGTMVFAVICYMAAFTASSLDLIETAQLDGLREVRTNTCHPLRWELVTQASEVLILCFGLHLSFASRNANTQFRERQFLVASLVVEFLVSSSYYVLRIIYLQELSPGAILLALFLRSQLTNTISLGLIFVPKLWYQHKQVRSLAHDLSIRLPVDAFKGSHDVGHHLGGGYAGLCLGDPDIGELTISEMSPEDIRAELKRLYTQLEILKNKTLRQDNPHISKRRGGRKAGHRRFSLQALSAKHRSNKHHQDVEITEAEPSRTPEDSVCSAEGPTDTYAEISGISHSMLSHSAVSHSVVSHSK